MPSCLLQSMEDWPLDADWRGARPADGIERLHDVVGDWSFFGDDDHPGIVRLRATAEPAHAANIYRYVPEQPGENCGAQERLGVPMRLGFASDDGTWSISGRVVFFYSDDFGGTGEGGWAFDGLHSGTLQVLEVDDELVHDKVSAACSDALVANLHGSHRDMDDGSRILTIRVEARCDDGFARDIFGGAWTVSPGLNE